jgi:hypothetical protein
VLLFGIKKVIDHQVTIEGENIMNIKSEHGQAEIAIVLILAIIAIAAFFGMMAANQRGMQAGAETIGDAASDAIDNAANASETYVAWKGTQTLYPSKYAIRSHGADAYATVDCYNRNGAFHVMSNADGDFNLLCRDDDGTVRDMILKRRGKSNIFDFVNAYTPKDGVFSRITYWLENTWKCGKGSMPNDAIIVIDNVTP